MRNKWFHGHGFIDWFQKLSRNSWKPTSDFNFITIFIQLSSWWSIQVLSYFWCFFVLLGWANILKLWFNVWIKFIIKFRNQFAFNKLQLLKNTAMWHWKKWKTASNGFTFWIKICQTFSYVQDWLENYFWWFINFFYSLKFT